MCNYQHPVNTSYDFTEDGFCLKASEDIPRGEEVYLLYGYHDKGNGYFLYNYGFLPNTVDKNGVVIHAPITQDTPDRVFKVQIAGETTPEHYIWDSLDSENTWRFFRWVRFLVFVEADVKD